MLRKNTEYSSGGNTDAKDGSYRATQFPHHVVQREHNRKVVFAEDDDFERYVAALRRHALEYGVRVYAWCLMTNHIHLLLCPRIGSINTVYFDIEIENAAFGAGAKERKA